MRQVKIDEQLFYDICKYIFTGNKDTEEQNIKLEEIRKQLYSKVNKICTRECYKDYLSAPEDTKEELLRKYIDSKHNS